MASWLASLLLGESQQRVDDHVDMLFEREAAATEAADVAVAAAAEGPCGALGRGATGAMSG